MADGGASSGRKRSESPETEALQTTEAPKTPNSSDTNLMQHRHQWSPSLDGDGGDPAAPPRESNENLRLKTLSQTPTIYLTL